MYSSTDMTHVFRIKTLYTAFAQEIGEKYFFVGERHNFWELVIAVEGQVGVVAGENAWVLQKGQAVLHPPMEFHRVWYPGNEGRIIIFSFAAEGLPTEAGGSFAADLEQAQWLLQQMGTCFQFDRIFVVGLQKQELQAQILLKQWELFLLNMMSQKRLQRHEAQSRTAKNYAAIMKILESHIYENLSVAQIAALCNMSQISVKQTFSRYTGMGIMHYFNRLKMEAAVNMLRSGSSVQETATALGFSNQNYFSTAFKRIMGRSPTAYK